MEFLMPYILDLAVILIIFGCIVSGSKRGFASSFVSLVGFVLSFAAAIILSRIMAEIVFSIFIEGKLYTLFDSSITGLTDNTEIFEQLVATVNSLPNYVVNMLEFDTGGLTYSLENSIMQSTEAIVKIVVDGIIAPVIKGLLRGILFIIIFFVCNTISKIATSLLKGVKYIPLIGTINSLLGGAIGIIYGVIYTYILVAISILLIVSSNNSLSMLTAEAVEESSIFSKFTSIGDIVGIYNTADSLFEFTNKR